ncbi:MAG: adenylyl-sulfate kinase [Salinivirgaceae bacterium]|jgi:adenylylsulfate kinase-like enzyme|nr:adenylyl-sulfate kinase [Salinivirgaceae bacterium]
MVIWLIGMSASGKTTIGKKLFDKLSLSNEKWLFLDGDTFRNILGEDLGHTIEDRRKNAYRISRFCEFLSTQGINVLACVLSIFHENQKYNKENIGNYKEVFIDVNFDNLVKRDNKDLYKKALHGEIENVVGVDIEFKPPYSPDLIIDNNIDSPNYDDMVQQIINAFKIEQDNKYGYTLNNLLERPHKYQYSKFEGVKMFEKFRTDRSLCIDFLNNRLQRLKNNNLEAVEIVYKEHINENNLVLRDFLFHLYNSDRKEMDKEESIIELIIKRFEVSKKLHLTYDKNEIRKSSKQFGDLLNYPLFSLVLQKYYNNTGSQQKLVYLNAILKVNDIISSAQSDFILFNEIDYSLKAFIGELKIIGEFIND